MARTCVYCGKVFEKQTRGYKRHSFQSKLRGTEQSVQDAAIDVFDLSSPVSPRPAEDRALCNICYGLLEKITKRNKELSEFKDTLEKRAAKGNYFETRKRKRPTPTMEVGSSSHLHAPSPTKLTHKSARKTHVTETRFVRDSFVAKVITLIKRSQYHSAFNLLFSSSKVAKRSFLRFIITKIRQEVRSFLKGDNMLMKTLTRDTAENFSWGSVLEETTNKMPVLQTVLEAAMTTKHSYRKVQVSDEHNGDLVPGLGMALGLLLHLRSPSKIKLVQQMNSIEMYKGGSSQKEFQGFHKLGICLGIGGTMRLVDRLVQQSDKDILSMKKNIERDISDDEVLVPEEGNLERTDVRQRLFQNGDKEDDEEEGVQPLDNIQCPGYSLCWNNIQPQSVALYQPNIKQHKFLLGALSYAAVNRISFRHLDDLDNLPTKRAVDLNLQCFLPSIDDWTLLRTRMEHIVTRIVCKHMEYFQSFKDEMEDYIPHQYIQESKKKSTIINLGIIKENPATNNGVVAIMNNLNKYVPQRNPGDPYPILCHGDQSSAERMVEGRHAMADSEDPSDRLIGLVPNCQDFYERCIILQDTMNMLFSENSAGNEGTLFHLKTIFKHTNVKKNISHCINDVESLLNFTTEAMVVLAAMKLLNITDIDARPENAPTEDADKPAYLGSLAADIVSLVWPSIDYQSIHDVVNDGEHDDDEDDDHYDGSDDDEEDEGVYCLCDSNNAMEDDFGWIECSRRGKCHKSRWYHLHCVDIDPDNIPKGDWWCCEDCGKNSIFCCRKKLPDSEWIACSRGDRCVHGKWFHLECKGLTKMPDTNWFCSESCKTIHQELLQQASDHVFQYSSCLTWRGLYQMVHKEVERHADGEAIIRNWRLDMVQFWQHDHFKYLIQGHRLLAGVNGWLPRRLADELTWNRTANLHGGLGNNIALDFVNEFLNNEFKLNLNKRCRGQYTDTQIDRSSKLVGSLGKSLEKVHFDKLPEKYQYTPHTTSGDTEDVRKFVSEFKSKNLFSCIPHRQHRAFPKFEHSISVKNPQELKERLINYSKELDVEKTLLLLKDE
ncbi:uncharacterized protein [Ptychodera flava]|uniref:uncharacterized protein isoform X2 n=1 Tax=Ptychodera flava TaxID=63121 RepID=UPI003969EFB2